MNLKIFLNIFALNSQISWNAFEKNYRYNFKIEQNNQLFSPEFNFPYLIKKNSNY